MNLVVTKKDQVFLVFFMTEKSFSNVGINNAILKDVFK